MSSLCPALSFSRTKNKNSMSQSLLNAHGLLVQNVRPNVSLPCCLPFYLYWGVKSCKMGLKEDFWECVCHLLSADCQLYIILCGRASCMEEIQSCWGLTVYPVTQKSQMSWLPMAEHLFWHHWDLSKVNLWAGFKPKMWIMWDLAHFCYCFHIWWMTTW